MAYSSTSKHQDYYSILEVERDATAETIKKSFRKLALAYHPDRNDDPQAEAQFKLINEAYAVLSDPEKRRRYDRYGHDETPNDPFQSGGVNASDLRDIFGDDLFQTLFSSLFGGVRRAQPPKNIHTQLRITLEEVLAGGEREVKIKRTGSCSPCHGSGFRNGQKRKCSRCGGQGQVRVNRGFLAIAQMCPDCGGSGADATAICHPCHGSGLAPHEAVVKVKIPVGVEEGHLLRVKEAGHQSKGYPQQSDVMIKIEIEDHKLYERDGLDLYHQVSAPYDVVALGGKVTVPLLGGGHAQVKVPAGTPSGQALRLKRKGLPRLGDSTLGDLFVYVEVKVPKVLSATERELLVALRELRDQGGELKNGDSFTEPKVNEHKSEHVVKKIWQTVFGKNR